MPCFSSSSHPLLSADELAMEARPVEKDDQSASVHRAHAAGGELQAPRLWFWVTGGELSEKEPSF